MRTALGVITLAAAEWGVAWGIAFALKAVLG